jgi:hypothetical protein
MSNFLPRTSCAALRAGHRTLPPSHRRPGRKAQKHGARGSGRHEDPHREATRGDDPVTGSAGSEGRPGRGGRHPASSPRGPLGAHTIERPSPLLPLLGRPCRSRGWRSGQQRSSTPRGNSRRWPEDGGAGSGGADRARWASSPPHPRASWCSYHQVSFTTLVLCRLAGGRPGPYKFEDPHREATRGVGPVTGSAGSEGRCGRGGRHHFRLKAEGPFRSSYLLKGPSPFAGGSTGARAPLTSNSGQSRRSLANRHGQLWPISR